MTRLQVAGVCVEYYLQWAAFKRLFWLVDRITCGGSKADNAASVWTLQVCRRTASER